MAHNKISCMICNKSFKCPTEPTDNKYTIRVLSMIFNTLFKTLGVPNQDVNNWDFTQDPFPFCRLCRNQVAKLCHLSQDLDKINKKINKTVAHITSTVVETRGSSYSRAIPCSSKSLRNGYMQVEEKISGCRDRIKQRFSPQVQVNRQHAIVTKILKQPINHVQPDVIVNGVDFFGGDSGDLMHAEEFNDEYNGLSYVAVEIEVDSPAGLMDETSNNADGNSNSCEESSQPHFIEVATSETMMKREALQRPMRQMKKLPNGNLAYEGFEVQTYPDGGAKCLTCGLEFNKQRRRKYMLEHLRIVHVKEDGKFQCHICGKQFNTKPHLKQHERTHLEVRAFECPICSHTFKTAVERNRHAKRHSEYDKEMVYDLVQ